MAPVNPDVPVRRTTDELVDAAEERLAEAADLPERIAAVRGWAESAGGEVRVTVDGRGALVDLQFADSVRRADPDAIAHAIMELAALATQAANRQSANELGRAMGDRIVEMLPEMGIPDLMSIQPPPLAGRSAAIDHDPPATSAESDDDLRGVDFSRFRSDR